jgi:hypothetical protein
MRSEVLTEWTKRLNRVIGAEWKRRGPSGEPSSDLLAVWQEGPEGQPTLYLGREEIGATLRETVYHSPEEVRDPEEVRQAAERIAMAVPEPYILQLTGLNTLHVTYNVGSIGTEEKALAILEQFYPPTPPPSYPSRMASPFANALQRGRRKLFSWMEEEEAAALEFQQMGERVAEREAWKRARALSRAIDLYQTRPTLTLREWEALWGLHALLRQQNYPRRLVFTRAEYYEAAGARTSYDRGRKDIAHSDRDALDEAIQSLFEREVTIFREWTEKGKTRRAELHLHLLTDWGKVEEPEAYSGEDRYGCTFHEVVLEAIREQFVNLPPMAEVKAALAEAGASGRGGGMRVDLELVVWLHANPYHPHNGSHHVDWQELAERLGLGAMLARGEKKQARKRLVLAYDRAVKAGYLLSYALDQPGGFGRLDYLVKNTAKLRGTPPFLSDGEEGA